MKNSKNNDNLYNPLEWKYVKLNKDNPKQLKGNNLHWCLNHNYVKGMWVVHLPLEWKSSETPNTQFQKPAKYKNDNQTLERGERHLKLLDNLPPAVFIYSD